MLALLRLLVAAASLAPVLSATVVGQALLGAEEGNESGWGLLCKPWVVLET